MNKFTDSNEEVVSRNLSLISNYDNNNQDSSNHDKFSDDNTIHKDVFINAWKKPQHIKIDFNME